jgi:hypothetical protein
VIAFDRFQGMKKLNESVDKVRCRGRWGVLSGNSRQFVHEDPVYLADELEQDG